MYVVATGNVVDGLGFFGPFDDVEEAADWAEHEIRNDEWNVFEVEEARP